MGVRRLRHSGASLRSAVDLRNNKKKTTREETEKACLHRRCRHDNCRSVVVFLFFSQLLRREKKQNLGIRLEKEELQVYHRFGEDVKHRTKRGMSLVKDALGEGSDAVSFVSSFLVLCAVGSTRADPTLDGTLTRQKSSAFNRSTLPGRVPCCAGILQGVTIQGKQLQPALLPLSP